MATFMSTCCRLRAAMSSLFDTLAFPLLPSLPPRSPQAVQTLSSYEPSLWHWTVRCLAWRWSARYRCCLLGDGAGSRRVRRLQPATSLPLPPWRCTSTGFGVRIAPAALNQHESAVSARPPPTNHPQPALLFSAPQRNLFLAADAEARFARTLRRALSGGKGGSKEGVRERPAKAEDVVRAVVALPVTAKLPVALAGSSL